MLNNNFFLGHGKYWLDGQVMVAAADGDGVYLSIDFGDTWTLIGLGTVIDVTDTFAGISLEYTYDDRNFVIITAVRNKGISRYYHYQGYNSQVSFYTQVVNFDRMHRTEGPQIAFSDNKRLYSRRYYDSLSGTYDSYSYSFPFHILDYSGSNGEEVVLLEDGNAYVGSMYFNNDYSTLALPAINPKLLLNNNPGWWVVGPYQIAKSIDGGANWSYYNITPFSPYITTGEKYNIAGHSFLKLLMLAVDEKVYRCIPNIYSSSADTWYDCGLPSGDYYWVDVADDNVGITAKYGGKIMVTQNKGVDWTEKFQDKNWSRVTINQGKQKRY